MMKSTLFLNHITCVDHAYIDNSGHVVGGSYSPSFKVSGVVEEHEQVVVDFSNIKKRIKEIIDDKVNGFDHKLWWLEGYSAGVMISSGTTLISTDKVELNLVNDAVREIRNTFALKDGLTLQHFMGITFAEHVEKMLRKQGLMVDVECVNSETKQLVYDAHAAEFRYTHGLKNSSSYGCQNIAHGHLSFVQVLAKRPENQSKCDSVANFIAERLHNAMFVYSNNVVWRTKRNAKINIAYTSPRGSWQCTVDEIESKVIEIPSETTVENLVDYALHQFSDELVSCGADELYISEGLSKGAVAKVEGELLRR